MNSVVQLTSAYNCTPEKLAAGVQPTHVLKVSDLLTWKNLKKGPQSWMQKSFMCHQPALSHSPLIWTQRSAGGKRCTESFQEACYNYWAQPIYLVCAFVGIQGTHCTLSGLLYWPCNIDLMWYKRISCDTTDTDMRMSIMGQCKTLA